MRITYSGKISLELTTSAAAVAVRLTDQAMINKFGPVVTGSIDLAAGDQLPYRLALLSALREAWVSDRQVDIYLSLTMAINPQTGQPDPQALAWLGVDDYHNFPFMYGQLLLFWVCERVILK